jgi:hypothetical protein
MKWIMLNDKIWQGLKVGLPDSQLDFVAKFVPYILKTITAGEILLAKYENMAQIYYKLVI